MFSGGISGGCCTRHLPEQKLRSLSRHAQKLWPPVQQVAIFLISLPGVTLRPESEQAWRADYRVDRVDVDAVRSGSLLQRQMSSRVRWAR